MQKISISQNPLSTTASSYFNQWTPLNWTHQSDADFGFKQCSFDLVGRPYDLEEMIYNGLTRRVTRYSEDGNVVIFDGYIDQMTLTEPGMRVRADTRDLYNSVVVVYTQLNTGVNPPTETANTATAAATDSDSQAMYGTKELIHRPPIVKMTAGMATQLRDNLLAQYKSPKPTADVVSGERTARLHVVCSGYMGTLDWRVYNQTVNSGTQNASSEVIDILAASGSFVSGSKIDLNSTQVNKYTGDYTVALKRLQDIAAIGDTNNNRWLVYMYEDREIYYEQQAYSITYFRRMSDPKQQIFDLFGRTVPYWEIRPNTWIRTSDIQPFEVTPSDLIDDRSAMYIESVRWNENTNTINLWGSKANTPQVLVARMSNQGEGLL